MERRRSTRRTPSPAEPLSRVRLRTGHEFVVIDVSDAGLLVEGERLLPGTRADVHIVTTDGRVLVRGRIVRACVCELRADRIRYRAALAFEEAVNTAPAGYPIPARTTAGSDATGSGYPSDGRPPQQAVAQRLTA